MPHLHLSLQAGSALILKRMKRRHTPAEAPAVIARARAARPGIAIGADLIAGFPTETDELFQETLDFVQQRTRCRSCTCSRTASGPARPPRACRRWRSRCAARAARLREAGQAASRAFFAGQQDQIVSILTESGQTGHTEHFAPVRLVAETRSGTRDARRGSSAPLATRCWRRRPDGAGGFFNRLKEGLSRSTSKITETLTTVFKKRQLDDEALEELEDLLISADLGVDAAARVIAAFRRSRFGNEVTDEEIRQALAEEIAAILAPVAKPLVLDPALQAACRAGGRRERHRQDDDDRQAGAAVSR